MPTTPTESNLSRSERAVEQEIAGRLAERGASPEALAAELGRLGRAVRAVAGRLTVIEIARGVESRAAGPEPVRAELSWDWKGRPYLDDLRDALERFGLFVHEHPGYEGMSHFCYVVSDREISETELEEMKAEFLSEE